MRKVVENVRALTPSTMLRLSSRSCRLEEDLLSSKSDLLLLTHFAESGKREDRIHRQQQRGNDL